MVKTQPDRSVATEKKKKPRAAAKSPSKATKDDHSKDPKVVEEAQNDDAHVPKKRKRSSKKSASSEQSGVLAVEEKKGEAEISEVVAQVKVKERKPKRPVVEKEETVGEVLSEEVGQKKPSKKRKAKDVDDSPESPPKKSSKISSVRVTPKSTSSRSTKAEHPKGEDKPERPRKTRKSKRVPSPSPAPEPEASDAGEVEEEVVDEEPGFFGFSTDDDDDDSSDEEDVDIEIPGIDSKLPTIAKDDATVKRKLEKAKRKPTEDRGVLFLGRIPHGFHEDQMRGYFSQFGDVTRLRLSRNKRTGRSKHYAFIEFDSSSVAKIVAETMDNYLLMGHILTCKVIPKDEVHPELWIGANKKWRAVPSDRVVRVRHNKARTEDEQKKAEGRLLKRQKERKRKLEEAGIEYDFDAAAYKKKAKSTRG